MRALTAKDVGRKIVRDGDGLDPGRVGRWGDDRWSRLWVFSLRRGFLRGIASMEDGEKKKYGLCPTHEGSIVADSLV